MPYPGPLDSYIMTFICSSGGRDTWWCFRGFLCCFAFSDVHTWKWGLLIVPESAFRGFLPTGLYREDKQYLNYHGKMAGQDPAGNSPFSDFKDPHGHGDRGVPSFRPPPPLEEISLPLLLRSLLTSLPVQSFLSPPLCRTSFMCCSRCSMM